MFAANTSITELGFLLLLVNYVPSFLFIKYILLGNVPERLPSDSYAKVVVVKVVFAVLLSIMASSGGGGGVFRPVSGVAAIPASLGGGYFIASMVLDMVLMVLLWRGEFYGAAKMVMFNVIYVPFLTFLAVLYGLFHEQGKTIKRVREDLPRREDGVLLGHAAFLMRVIEKPVRGLRDVDVRPHGDIRPLPVEPPVYYSPKVGENDLNPHMLIAGSSGTGKTTTIYSLVRGLSKNYPVIFVDVKGDVTRALLGDGANSYILPVAQVGINPFSRVVDTETERDGVEDLMSSISVVEQVGSRQAHYIREAYAEIYHSGKKLTYTGLVQIIDRKEKESVLITSPESRRGPGTKDALYSISSKLKDLSEYLRDDGASLKELLGKGLKGGDSGFPIIVFNLEGISENIRAIVLELILRKIAKYLFMRGPLAYLSDVPLVLVVDEAYLVTRPMDRQGAEDGASKSILEEIARTGRSYGVALVLVTQRLSDIADGIRQNCDKWIVFRTVSPGDLRVLEVDDRLLGKVATQLGKGYAYIRLVTGRRLEGMKYTSDVSATTVGYLFRMERQPLKFEAEGDGEGDRPSYRFLMACYRCKLAIKNPLYCPFCGGPPMLERPVLNLEFSNGEVGGKDVEGRAVPTSSQAGGSAVPAVFVDWEEVRRRAIEKHPDMQEVLSKLTHEQIAGFLTNYPNYSGAERELYSKLLLLRASNGVVRMRRAGAVLLEAYKEVAGK